MAAAVAGTPRLIAAGTGVERGCAAAGAALAAGQIAIALAGVETTWVVALPAVAAVGLALAPLLPADLRAQRLALAASVAPVGTLALMLAMVAIGGLGIPFTALATCAVLAAFAVTGLVAARRVAPVAAEPAQRWAWPAAAGAVLIAVGLALVVNHELPPAGNDWAKYLLYADEIRAQHHTLIDNQLWLLGQPFREDPGVPVLYATLLVISGGGAGGLGWGIVVLVALGALAMVAALVALFGPRAGVAGALVFALEPATADMSAWHGAANMLGLVAMPICVMAAGMLLRGSRDPRWTWLLALGVVGVACAHRLSAVITLAALLAVGAGALIRARGEAWSVLRRLAVAVAAIGVLPAIDLLRRDSGGVLDYRYYLTTKIDWGNVARDLTWPCVAIVAVAIVVLARGRRRDPVIWLALAIAGVSIAYAYAWVIHVPGFYARAAYFLPVAAGLLAAAAATALRPRVLLAALPALALSGVLAVHTAADARDFYRFVDRASLRGFDELAARMRPGESVLTDHCTSFIATWLARAPTLAALRDDEIGPAAELARVRDARTILRGDARGRALARRHRTRWLVLNPECPGRPVRPPRGAEPVYVSTRLVVFALT